MAGMSRNMSGVAEADALGELRALPISDAYVPARYDRDAFGPAWADVDHNGCDTRNDVLRRDLTAVVTRKCVVLSGTLQDPYTGRTIVFERGKHQAWPCRSTTTSRCPTHGATAPRPGRLSSGRRSPTTRRRTSSPSTGPRTKRSPTPGPAEWMPTNTGDACNYAASFVTVATKWQLSIATAD